MKLMPSSPPHIRSQDSNATVMFYVICALGSLYFMGTFFYGMRALVLGVLSVVTCLATDLLCTRLAGRKICLWDYSSIVTGMLIPLFMPASISYWIVVAAGVSPLQWPSIPSAVWGRISLTRLRRASPLPQFVSQWQCSLTLPLWESWPLTQSSR